MSNYLDHPGAGPLDDLLLSFFPTGASDGQPFDAPEPQHIPGVKSGMKQLLWEWDHRDGMDAEHLVEKYGVRVSGRIVPKRENDLVGFSVPDHHAQWAEYILLRAGYPLVTPLVNPAHARLLERSWHTGPSRPVGGSQRSHRHGLIDRLWHWTDAIVAGGASSRERRLPTAQHWSRQPQPPRPQPRPSFLRRLAALLSA